MLSYITSARSGTSQAGSSFACGSCGDVDSESDDEGTNTCTSMPAVYTTCAFLPILVLLESSFLRNATELLKRATRSIDTLWGIEVRLLASIAAFFRHLKRNCITRSRLDRDICHIGPATVSSSALFQAARAERWCCCCDWGFYIRCCCCRCCYSLKNASIAGGGRGGGG